MSVPNMNARSTLLQVLSCVVLGLSSNVAFAATPEEVIQKSQEVRQYVRMNAYRMNSRELAMVDQQLSQILRGTAHPQPYPQPYPPRPPIPQAQCELLGRGLHGGFTYNFRLALNGQSMEASDNLDSILGRLDQYRRDGICSVVIAEALKLSARGPYGGFTYNFRVMLRGEAIAASDNMETALGILSKIDAADAGRISAPNVPCQLLPRGEYGGFNYNFRVGVGAEVMIASDSYQTATSAMQRLRSANICY